MRPRLTASSTTSWIRSRVSITRLSGATTPFAITSRTSATFVPDNCGAAAFAWRARFCAVCWRPRALPPFLAALLRAAVEEPPDRERDCDRARVREPPPDQPDPRPPREPLAVSALSPPPHLARL